MCLFSGLKFYETLRATTLTGLCSNFLPVSSMFQICLDFSQIQVMHDFSEIIYVIIDYCWIKHLGSSGSQLFRLTYSYDGVPLLQILTLNVCRLSKVS